MSFWSVYTAHGPSHLEDLIRRSRELIGGLGVANAGVFRERGALALYFSPKATEMLVPLLQRSVVICGQPDEMRAEVVAGPSDDPEWYALGSEEQRMLNEYLDELDEQGMVLSPDPFARPLRAHG